MSCASAKEEWKVETVSQSKEFWGWCESDIDEPQYVDRGWCWTYQECMTKKKFLRKDEKICRTLTKFCAAGDIECIKKNKLDEKILIDPSFFLQ